MQFEEEMPSQIRRLAEVQDQWSWTLEEHTTSVDAVAFSPDAKTVALASYDDTVWLWDAVSDVTLQTFENCLIKGLVSSRDGSTVRP